VTEGVLTVALTERTAFFHCEADQETKRVATKDWGKTIAFAPNSILVISQDNDSRLCPKREELFILFNCEDTHGRDSTRRTFLAQSAILAKGDLPKRTHAFNAPLFFEVTLHPNFSIRVGIGKRFQKGGRTVPMQVDRTDKGGNGIKRRLLRRCRRAEESVRDMPWDKNSFNTHINPCDRQIRKVDSPVFVSFIDMRFENETENAISFAEVSFVVLTLMFICYFGVESQEGRKE
jgi:hypothetical protein